VPDDAVPLRLAVTGPRIADSIESMSKLFASGIWVLASAFASTCIVLKCLTSHRCCSILELSRSIMTSKKTDFVIRSLDISGLKVSGPVALDPSAPKGSNWVICFPKNKSSPVDGAMSRERHEVQYQQQMLTISWICRRKLCSKTQVLGHVGQHPA
jgi:hypothetical protein